MIKGLLSISIYFTFLQCLFGQLPTRDFHIEEFQRKTFEYYGSNKIIPKEIMPQVLTALSFYPELRNVRIKFRVRKRKTPLTSRPRILSVFRKKKNRNYVITISNATTDRLTPILLSNLPYNAQIGVLGHELAHISHYNTQNTFQLIGLSLGMLRSTYVDEFEWNTDKSTIEHGLGYQLYDWSSYVRNALNIREWLGASQDVLDADLLKPKERYMNPKTILKHIQSNEQYNNILD